MRRILTLALVLWVPALAGADSDPPETLEVELFPFVGTSFVEIFAEDFTNPASPLAGETLDGFLARITSTPPSPGFR